MQVSAGDPTMILGWFLFLLLPKHQLSEKMLLPELQGESFTLCVVNATLNFAKALSKFHSA